MPKTKKSISVVLPCLNEEKTVRKCVLDAKMALSKLAKKGFTGEIIVVDNGSTDQSAILAGKAGAKVVFQKEKGYGAAYQKGISASRGKYIVIGDSDGTYDFHSIGLFIKELERGADLVLGSRFKGHIKHNSMPLLHRYLGNPLLTKMINLFYGCRLSDSQTGFRAFSQNAYKEMQLKSRGMEFASEMIFKSISHRLRVKEVPVDYYPRGGQSKLSPIKDAWRHITSILIYSPTYAFIIPGIIAFAVGLISILLLLPGPLNIGVRILDIHTMITAVFLTSIGAHVILTGFFARVYTVKKLGIRGGLMTKLILKYISLESLFLLGIILFVIAFATLGLIALSWMAGGFSSLSRQREFIAAAGLGMIGGQLIFSSFLFELLQKDV